MDLQSMISVLYENLFAITWQQCVMWLIGGILIYLAIKAKKWSLRLLLPMGFGAILVNLPIPAQSHRQSPRASVKRE